LKKDYYDILGVGRDASPDEMKRAFRKLAMQCHPDRHAGDKECEEKFKELNEAYSCLSDPEKRAHYDRFGTAEGVGAGFGGFGGFEGGFGDIFEDVFGDFFGAFTGRAARRRSRGVDLRYDLDITLEEAAFGTEKVINIMRWEECSSCAATGSRSKKPSACPDCRGAGQVRFQQGFFSVSRTCSRCRGEGRMIADPCPSCKGRGKAQKPREVSVRIPAGVDSVSRLKMSGEGEPGANGGPHGDLYIVIEVKPHEVFHREGLEVYSGLALTFPQAVLGAEVEVRTLDGPHKLKVPPATQPGTSLRIKGKGIPGLGRKARGDHIAVVKLEVPRKISQKQRELIEELAGISEEDGSGGIKDKIKGIFAGTHERH
jgi:molecular chaperone DnaJ